MAAQTLAVQEEEGGLATSRAPARWRVLVVEDDPAVARVHGAVVDSLGEFLSVGVASDLHAAERALNELRPEILILDLTMPHGDGIDFLRRARAESVAVDAIVVTASRDTASVRACLQLGVVDYLVKPFAPQRLRESLIAFAQRDRVFCRSHLKQDDVDALPRGGAGLRRLPRGLKRSTLRAIWDELQRSSEPRSAEEIGDQVGVARVTARRYLDYLEAVSLVELRRVPQAVGRPSNRYRVIRRPADG